MIKFIPFELWGCLMKSLTFLICILLSTVLFAQNNEIPIYDLKVGTERYYHSCWGLAEICIPEGTFLSVLEKVESEELINAKLYSVISRLTIINNNFENVINDTLYQRMKSDSLVQLVNGTDSLLFVFRFKQNDTLLPDFVPQYSNQGDHYYPPKTVSCDTTIIFPDNQFYRVVFADDTTRHSSYLPSNKVFTDSILVKQNNWLLPSDFSSNYYFNKPFYYIQGIGVTKNIFNHLYLPLIGFKSANGTLYGSELQFDNVSDFDDKIKSFNLSQNYPNPFNPKTKIEFELKKSGFVKLEIFNTLGQKLETLINEVKSKGIHFVYFDGTKYSSGIYFYTLTSDNFSETKQMILNK